MAGDEQMVDLAELLAKLAGSGNVADSVADTLDQQVARGTAGTTEQLSGLSARIDQLRQASQQQANLVARTLRRWRRTRVRRGTSGWLA